MSFPDTVDAMMQERMKLRRQMAKDLVVRLMHAHQEGALSNLDTGNEECRCGKQGDQGWRPHFADVLLDTFPGITQSPALG